MAELVEETIWTKIERFNYLRNKISPPSLGGGNLALLGSWRLNREGSANERRLWIEEFKVLKEEISNYWDKNDPEHFAKQRHP